MNNFQKILIDTSNSRSFDDSKRLTFINFKTKRNQKDHFYSSPDAKNIQLTAKDEAKRVKTEPKAYTTSNFYLSKVSERLGFQSNLLI